MVNNVMLNESNSRPGADKPDLVRLGWRFCKASLPRPGEYVIVQCRDFRCLGQCDVTGQWHDVRTNQVLADVTGWCGLDDDIFTPVGPSDL